MHNRRFQVLSSVYGRIDEVLFVDPNEGRRADQIAAEYEEIYQNLAPHVKFFIVAHHTEAGSEAAKLYKNVLDRIRGAHGSNRTTVILYGSDPERGDANIRRFIQDDCMVLESEPGIRAVLATVPSRSNWKKNERTYLQTQVLHAFAAETDFLLKPFPYIIRGSDYLVGDNYMFVSESVLVKNAELLGMAFANILVYEDMPNAAGGNASDSAEELNKNKRREILEEALRCGFGVEQIIWVPQPRLTNGTSLFVDLDEILNLGGRIYDAKSDKFKELVFLAHPDLETFSGAPQPAAELLQELTKGFAEVRMALADHDHRGLEFEVVDLPVVVDINSNFRNGKNKFKYRSFNNCQIEVYQSFRNVYLPRYSYDCKIPAEAEFLKRIEKSVESVYREYGFKSTWLNGSFYEYSENRRASLHCITKVMRRSCAARHWNVPYGHKTLRYPQDKSDINRTFTPLTVGRLREVIEESRETVGSAVAEG